MLDTHFNRFDIHLYRRILFLALLSSKLQMIKFHDFQCWCLMSFLNCLTVAEESRALNNNKHTFSRFQNSNSLRGIFSEAQVGVGNFFPTCMQRAVLFSCWDTYFGCWRVCDNEKLATSLQTAMSFQMTHSLSCLAYFLLFLLVLILMHS